MDDGKPASAVAYEPSQNTQRCRYTAGPARCRGGVRYGIFTIPAARLIGNQGHLVAMDALADYTKRVTEKVVAAGLQNVTVVKRDALETGLDTATIDKALLFGVLPWPALPLNRLLPEMHRVIKPEGSMAVWQFPITGWVPKSILQSGLFTYLNKQNGVYSYRRC